MFSDLFEVVWSLVRFLDFLKIYIFMDLCKVFIILNNFLFERLGLFIVRVSILNFKCFLDEKLFDVMRVLCRFMEMWIFEEFEDLVKFCIILGKLLNRINWGVFVFIMFVVEVLIWVFIFSDII